MPDPWELVEIVVDRAEAVDPGKLYDQSREFVRKHVQTKFLEGVSSGSAKKVNKGVLGVAVADKVIDQLDLDPGDRIRNKIGDITGPSIGPRAQGDILTDVVTLEEAAPPATAAPAPPAPGQAPGQAPPSVAAVRPAPDSQLGPIPGVISNPAVRTFLPLAPQAIVGGQILSVSEVQHEGGAVVVRRNEKGEVRYSGFFHLPDVALGGFDPRRIKATTAIAQASADAAEGIRAELPSETADP